MTDTTQTASGVSEEMLDRARDWLDEQRAVVHPGPIETLRDLISMRRAALSAIAKDRIETQLAGLTEDFHAFQNLAMSRVPDAALETMSFWGMLKDGKLHAVYSDERSARIALSKVDPRNQHSWEIMPVQVSPSSPRVDEAP